MKQKEIKALMVAPGEHPREVVLKNDLDALQKAVSIGCDYQGLIEVVGLDNGVCIICNEEGKLLGLEGNRRLGGDIASSLPAKTVNAPDFLRKNRESGAFCVLRAILAYLQLYLPALPILVGEMSATEIAELIGRSMCHGD